MSSDTEKRAALASSPRETPPTTDFEEHHRLVERVGEIALRLQEGMTRRDYLPLTEAANAVMEHFAATRATPPDEECSYCRRARGEHRPGYASADHSFMSAAPRETPAGEPTPDDWMNADDATLRVFLRTTATHLSALGAGDAAAAILALVARSSAPRALEAGSALAGDVAATCAKHGRVPHRAFGNLLRCSECSEVVVLSLADAHALKDRAEAQRILMPICPLDRSYDGRVSTLARVAMERMEAGSGTPNEDDALDADFETVQDLLDNSAHLVAHTTATAALNRIRAAVSAHWEGR